MQTLTESTIATLLPEPILRDVLGRQLHDLRVSVIDACNFRCRYCMPAEKVSADHPFLRPHERLTFAEIERLVGLFLRLGGEKVRLTGGEPLLRPDLPTLVARLRALPGLGDLALSTNGTHLARLAAPLRQAGLDRVNVSLDALDAPTFHRLNGHVASPAIVFAGIAAAEAAGFAPIKLNCVVMRGVNEHAIVDLARFCHGHARIVRYIEYMDVGSSNGWQRGEVVSAAEIRARLEAEFTLAPLPPNYPGEVARRFRFADASGEVGIISSVTQPFCGGCTRARLTADGQLHTCLFAGASLDLKTPLRAGAADADLLELLATTWRHRRDRYSELRRHQASHPKPEMYRLGG